MYKILRDRLYRKINTIEDTINNIEELQKGRSKKKRKTDTKLHKSEKGKS